MARRFARFTRVSVAERSYYLLAHRPERVAALRAGANVQMPDVALQLQRYQPRSGELACDQWFLDTFYFRHHAPAERLSFLQRLVDAGHLDPMLQDFEATPPGEHPRDYTLVRSFELDAPEREGFLGSPDTLAAWAATRETIGQSEIRDAHGGFINSYTITARDDSEGYVASPVFEIEGDVIELYVAGGSHADLQMTLEVEREEVARTSGCDTELLGRRLWNVSNYKGKHARIWIRDQTRVPWGHLIVDRIREWRATPSSQTASRH